MSKRKRTRSNSSSIRSNKKRVCERCFNGPHLIDKAMFEGLTSGDIIQVENDNGKHEYMIYECYDIEKYCPNVFHAIPFECYDPPPPTWSHSIIQWLFGPKEIKWYETPKGLDKNKRMDIYREQASNVLQGKKFQKYNIADECLTPNEPRTIIERAIYKSSRWLYPQFQTDKDWAIWCRYGKDIVAHTGRQK